MKNLKEVINSFREDKNWNTENKDGSHRFDKEIEWIEKMVNEYADYFKMTADEVISIMEEKREYSWPNYYQESNFPSVDNFGKLIGIYKTFDEFQTYAKEHWKGFRCPKCKNVGRHPQECDHRIEKDGKCDWCSYGLFESGKKVVILESGFKAIPIFEPVEKE